MALFKKYFAPSIKKKSRLINVNRIRVNIANSNSVNPSESYGGSESIRNPKPVSETAKEEIIQSDF